MATSSSSDSPTGNSIPNSILPADPLLEHGSFIDATKKEEISGDKPVPAKTPQSKKRAKETSERPSWIPEGWTVEVKVRERGVIAGTTDRYYYPPNRASRFRSRKEVENFIRTGSKSKTSESSAGPSESPPSAKKKKSKSSSKSGHPTLPTPLKFDFENVPDSTIWRLNDGPKDLWVPYIDDEMVPISTKQEWDAACHDLASGMT